MDLQYTLEIYAMQLPNKPRTFETVASVCRKMMATLMTSGMLI